MAETTPRPTAAAPPSADSAGGDWPAQITAQIVRVIDQVRDRTTRPATLAVRALVYGTVVGFTGIAIAIVLFIGLFRLVDVIRELIVEDAVWLTYLTLGLLFTVVGAILFASRKPSV
jgi:hypothetical protein